jgi:hypothetical protein
MTNAAIMLVFVVVFIDLNSYCIDLSFNIYGAESQKKQLVIPTDV